MNNIFTMLVLLVSRLKFLFFNYHINLLDTIRNELLGFCIPTYLNEIAKFIDMIKDETFT
jgi:hypothetical protein